MTEDLTAEATSEVTSSVDYTVSSMKSKMDDASVSPEEKQRIKKALDHFESNNSYLYFSIADINDAYKNFEEEYKGSTMDVASRAYPSLSTEYGNTDISEASQSSRVVNFDQKQQLFKHILMTEKYNFNMTKWMWFGHGHDGEEMTDSNFVFDNELGLKYPSDNNNNKIDTFISLLSPYMQTWHIPLAMHSAFITKSGSSETASKFTYSVIKNTYSDIVAHRYDIQKYTLNTKFSDYMRKEYRSKFDLKIELSESYVPQVERVNTKITNVTNVESATVVSSGVVTIDSDEVCLTAVKSYCSTDSSYKEAKTEKVNGKKVVDAEKTFSSITSTGVYYAVYATEYSNGKVSLNVEKWHVFVSSKGNVSSNRISTTTIQVDANYGTAGVADRKVDDYLSEHPNYFKVKYASDGSKNLYSTYETALVSGDYTCVWAEVYEQGSYAVKKAKYHVEVDTSNVTYKTDANGKIIYDATVSYKYLADGRNYNQYLESERYDNTRIEGDPLTVDKSDPNIQINPLLEEEVSHEITITNKYYIKDAKTFDVNIANEYNYIKYSDEDVANRINPKSESETNLEKFYEEENIENKIYSGNILNYVSNQKTIGSIDIDTRLIVDKNDFKDSKSELYEKLKNTLPNTNITFTTISPHGGIDPLTRSYTNTNTYTNKYSAKNTYIVKEGLPENNQGTHYIKRIWEDTLTQTSNKKELYTIDDLIEYNANYNSKLNGTEFDEEKENYQKFFDKNTWNASEYQGLAENKELNNIYFMNSNINIFDEYLVDMSSQSEITGYDLEWIKFALDEIKNLFKQTIADNDKIPYIYGESLGLISTLENNTNKTTGGVMNLSITQTSISRDDFIAAVQSYGPGISKGSATADFMNNAGVIYDICVSNNINPVICAGQAWREQGWVPPGSSPFNYWGIAVYTGQSYGRSYSSIEDAVNGYCILINAILNKDTSKTGGVDYAQKAAEFATVNNKFKGDFSSIYDAFSAYCSPKGAESMPISEVADYVANYVDVMIDCIKNIFPNVTITSGSSSDVVNFALQFEGKKANEFDLFNYSSQCGVRDVWFQADWCAMFVSFCYDNCGGIPDPLPNSFCGCIDGYSILESSGKAKDSNYIPNPGDLIFFDWDGTKNTSNTHHVGIVVSCDGNNVYTIEGNTNSSNYNTSVVAQHTYPIISRSICGYGDMSK